MSLKLTDASILPITNTSSPYFQIVARAYVQDIDTNVKITYTVLDTVNGRVVMSGTLYNETPAAGSTIITAVVNRTWAQTMSSCYACNFYLYNASGSVVDTKVARCTLIDPVLFLQPNKSSFDVNIPLHVNDDITLSSAAKSTIIDWLYPVGSRVYAGSPTQIDNRVASYPGTWVTVYDSTNDMYFATRTA